MSNYMDDFYNFYSTINENYNKAKINSKNDVLIEIYDENEKYDFFLMQISKYVDLSGKDLSKTRLSDLGKKSFFMRLRTI